MKEISFSNTFVNVFFFGKAQGKQIKKLKLKFQLLASKETPSPPFI